MNQEKIGKFISLLRKDNNMTQKELADKLNVTDRAISNWENGRRMPDIVFFKPLCEIFNITLNELLSGEKIQSDNNEKSDEIIINTIDYSNKKIKHTKLIYRTIIIVIVGFILIIASLFGIDMYKMSRNEDVFFSYWGLNYYPPVNLKEELIDKSIKDYLIKEDESHKRFESSKTFVAMKTFLIKKENDKIIVDAWILMENYYEANGEIKEDSGSSIPYKFTLKNDGSYEVINYEIPRDGGYYSKDIKRLFSRRVIKMMDNIHRNSTFNKLQFQIDEQVSLYFHK